MSQVQPWRQGFLQCHHPPVKGGGEGEGDGEGDDLVDAYNDEAVKGGHHQHGGEGGDDGHVVDGDNDED